jgi:hypothetical protein
MGHELELIQQLERVARLVETGNDAMAVATLDKMIYDLCQEVTDFERMVEEELV